MSFNRDHLPTIDTRYEIEAFRANRLRPAFFVEQASDFYTPGFFAHHDPKEPTLLRFHPPKEPAKTTFSLSKDFLTMKPGKFLAEFFDDKLTPPEIAKLAAKFRADGTPPELFFARTADEIAMVYNTGPDSCMKKSKSDWGGGIETIRAYAGPDLAIAYIKRGTRPSARALCWPEKKIHSRIYGDEISLRLALTAAGYTDCFTTNNMAKFHGARLTPIPATSHNPALKVPPTFRVPYGDAIKYLNHLPATETDPEFLQIVSERDWQRIHTLTGGISRA